ncbi:MAG: hypothetical protein IPM24_18960, partial [Bryobacterales bacterium]|nr:hypothetical protein [Bryobacterales bacterium]
MTGRRGVFGRVLWIVLGAAACAPAMWAQEECSSCHDQKVAGVHEPLPCLTCHEGRDAYPHPANVTNPSCGSCHEEIAKRDALGIHAEVGRNGGAAPECSTCHGAAHDVQVARSETFRKAQPETCGMCHSEPAEHFQASVHGTSLAAGAAGAPTCTTCHGAHDILAPRDPAAAVNPSHIRETCAGCHENLLLTRQFRIPADRVLSFDQSFHGLAAKAGSTTVANCASCHSYHDILPSSDPKSSVHPDNLPATCGQCHPGAGQRFTIGPVHTLEGEGEVWQVEAVTSLYLFLIPAVIGLMMLHNIGDFVRKLWTLRISPPAAPPIPAGRPEVRMLPFERLQHGLLVISFSVLVWSGFALKYSGEWWAQPLARWEAQMPVRGFVHRGAAIVLVAVSFIHLFSL